MPSSSEATAQGQPLGSHHALPPEEVGDHVFIQVVHEASGALVIAAAVDEELLPGVLVDEGADLKGGRDKIESFGVLY